MRAAGVTLILALASTASADFNYLAPEQYSNPAATALSRITASQHYSVGAAAFQPGDLLPAETRSATHLGSNLVYYAAMDLPGLNPPLEINDQLPGDSGVIVGGGGLGSQHGGLAGGYDQHGNPYVPAPGAFLLALIGMVCVDWVRRRRI